MRVDLAAFIAACARELPAASVLSEQDLMQSYERDGLGKHAGRACIVLRPEDTAGVSRAVSLCHRLGVAIVPQGGNTGFCGGAIPDESGRMAILSLSRMRTIRKIDLVGNAIAVDAGVTLQALQDAARQAGRLFPLSHGGEGSSQIGGNIATNAGGNAVLRYGSMRALVLGLEIVLPDGRVLDLMRSLRKDTAGYDLKQLFIGAEGTLGIITGATLKLFAKPERIETALLAIAEARQAAPLLARLQGRLGEVLTAFELMPRLGLDLHFAASPAARDPFVVPSPWYVLLEASSASRHFDLATALEEAIASEMADGIVQDAVLARSDRQRAEMWSLREGLAMAQVADSSAIKNDTSVPTDAIEAFLILAEEKVRAILPDIRPVPFGHVGDGNIHYNLVRPVDLSPEDFKRHWPALIAAVEDAAQALGGSIAAEHGIGSAKLARLAEVRPGETELMRAIKRALDPLNLMNPGKVV